MTPVERHFNLLDEPWLPVRMKDGAVQWVGLLEVFRRSADIQALAETRPPSLVAEYRLLLAILHRALVEAVGRWQDSERVRWYQDGLPVDAACTYLEKWRHAFWLFDPERPFMQVAELAIAEKTRNRKKPWTQISLASAIADSPLLFDHSVDLLPSSIAIPEAVAHLLGFLQFTPAKTVQLFRFGKGANVSGPLVNTAAVLPVGEDIGQTLMLCLHAAPLEGQQAEDLPAWERRPLKVSDLESDPTLALGPNDRYSRQSRAVLLLRDSTGNRVQWIHFAEGLGLKDDPQQPDRMACFRAGKLNSIRVTFSAGRSVWRDLPSLVPAPEGSDVRAAATIDSAAALNRALRKLVRSQQVLVAGLASDRGKALQWRVEQFNLPQALLTNPERALELKSHLAKCEAVYSQLRRWAFDLQVAVLPDPTSKETVKRAWDLVERGPLSSLYFAAAERSLWALMELVGRDASDEADLFWQRGLRQSALGAWQRVVDTLGMSADALRAEARCRRRLLAALREHLPLTAPPAQTRSSKGASA